MLARRQNAHETLLPVQLGGARLSVLAALMMASAALASSALAEPSKGGRVVFEVLRGKEHFGQQSVTVTPVEGGFSVQTAADLRASLGPVTLFHYKQECLETWRGVQLAGLTCTTLRDGKKIKVDAAPAEGALKVTGAKKGPATFPVGTGPSTWWTKPKLGAYDMINTETGERMPVKVTSIGRETIDTGSSKITAEHIRVASTLSVDLWYDEAGHWVSCAFSASGQNMTYRLLTPAADGPA
jgi:hypothetical protein